MNLTQLREKLPVFAIPTVILVLLLTVAIVLALKTRGPGVVPAPTPPVSRFGPTATVAPNKITPPKIKPQQLPANVQQIREKIIASQIANRGGVVVLFQSDSFIIRYIPTPDMFFVTIFKEPVATLKKQAQDWFLNFGLKQSDLCDLPVRFVLSSRELRARNPGFTSLPDGCS